MSAGFGLPPDLARLFGGTFLGAPQGLTPGTAVPRLPARDPRIMTPVEGVAGLFGRLPMGAPQGFTGGQPQAPDPLSPVSSVIDGGGFDERFGAGSTGQDAGTVPPAAAAMRAALGGQGTGVPGTTSPARPASLAATGAADTSARAGAPGASMAARPIADASPADLPTPGAAPVMGAGSDAPEPGSFMAKWKELADTGLGDSLLALSSGLLSAGGGAGWAAGFDNMRKADQARALLDEGRFDRALKLRKATQEISGQNETVALLMRKGYSAEDARSIMAASAAGNSTALGNALNNIVPKAKEPEPFTLGANQTRYDAAGRPIVATGSDKPENFETESKLRGEFSKQLGSFGDVHDGYGRVIAATQQRANNPSGISPASDIGLIFGYMKMLDPGSVVREGEYATAANAAGIPERVRNAYNKAMNGEFLTADQRQDFVGQAGELYGTARKTAEAVSNRYRGLATQYGVDPDRTTYLPEVPVAPKVGRDRMKPDAAGGGEIPPGARRASDGKLYVPDPARPGKYLEVR